MIVKYFGPHKLCIANVNEKSEDAEYVDFFLWTVPFVTSISPRCQIPL
jgi:hypothetical protein